MNKKIIASVFKREPLWNSANELHKNAVVLKKLWEEVAVEVERDVKTVKAKWKNVRAYFFKECEKKHKPKSGERSAKIYKSTWQYYDQLLFLKSKKNRSEKSARDSNLIIDNDDNYSITTDSTSEDLKDPGSQQTSETTNNLESSSQTSQRNRIIMNRSKNFEKLLEIEKKKFEILQKESIKEKSDDALFFDSLLPFMKNIPLKRKLRLRSKIQDIILAEIEAEENISAPVINTPVSNINT